MLEKEDGQLSSPSPKPGMDTCDRQRLGMTCTGSLTLCNHVCPFITVCSF